ncbi:GNAT family N-acetyltransferase [Zooshikella ganghwensis]|uniref:GNAT family N-acetyltransferase n=1 Tax=Zooshikella ganghwensis TaxID=202772 RepID=A0A4V1IN61_9GAMM|nr:GNAT family N-acetyltransferase [Zooshikella ganghwensis]RDH42611.1 GNAT family N-acetyltransferase [Zooshikella ganghwensis]
MEITIRHSEANDINAIKKIYEQLSCFTGTLQLPFPSEQLWEKRLTQLDNGVYSLVAEVEGKIIGQLGLTVNPSPRRKHVASIGMAVSEEFQNKGAGSALLNAAIELSTKWLAIKCIELEVYTDNEPAIKLYKKLGFNIEGTAKAFAYKNGEYADVFLMARVSL